MPLCDQEANPKAEYRKLEAQIMRDELAIAAARWKFGKLLLAERNANGGKQLPHGRMDELLQSTARTGDGYKREIQHRMTCARRYPSLEEFVCAYVEAGSWSALMRPWRTKANEE